MSLIFQAIKSINEKSNQNKLKILKNLKIENNLI